MAFGAAMAGTGAPGAVRATTITVIPRPVSCEAVAGEGFALTPDLAIVADKRLEGLARTTAEMLTEMTGRRPDVVERTEGRSRLRLVLRGEPDAMVAGAYRLRVQPGEVVAEAASPEGLFYAVQTLRQLANPAAKGGWVVPRVEVGDAPRFRWRGLLVDVAAHFYPKAVLEQIIDRLAYYKMNVLHLHLTDYGGWRIEVPAYPRLAAVGGQGNLDEPGAGEPQFYTTSDLREIVGYAADRFVTIVPEVEMPGHAGAAARAYPEFFDESGTFNPAAPGVYDFIAAIVAELARVFPGPVIHFGGDEVSNAGWAARPEAQAFMRAEGLANADALQRYFYERVAKIVQSAGRRPMAWDETAEAGVGPAVMIEWWRKARPELRDAVLARGGELVLAPVDQVYLDYAAGPGEPGAPWEGNDNGPTSVEKILRWEPIPEAWTEAQVRGVAGIEAALWTEFIRTKGFLEFMLYPRLMAVAEVAWSPRGPREVKAFRERLGPHLDRLRRQGVNARVRLEDVYPYLTH